MYSLAIQNTYDEVQFALMHDTTQIAYNSISKLKASAWLIRELDVMLTASHLTLTDLSYIAANTGPGPFTTLRVVITTINGIAYATGIPLIGIDALHAAAQEWKDAKYPVTAILFNAFGNDVYTLISKKDTPDIYGVFSISDLIARLKTESESIRFLGNGALLHKQLIETALEMQAIVPEPTPNYCSLSIIAQMGYEQWISGKMGVSELQPVYLKQHPAVR